MELKSTPYKIQIKYADDSMTTIICYLTQKNDDYKFDRKSIKQMYDFYVDKECGIDVVGFSAMPYEGEENK